MDNSQRINVSCEPIVTIRNIKYITIKIVELIFNTTATLLISYYDENGCIIKNEFLNLTPEEYSQWGFGDKYIIDLVCRKYNLTLT